MRAFEIHLNDRKLCTAGVKNDGVLTATLTYVAGRGRNDLALDVGGLLSSTEEHVDWTNLRLKVGDEVRMKVVETESVDKPPRRHRRDLAEELRSQKRYVRRMARKLGRAITVRRPKSD